VATPKGAKTLEARTDIVATPLRARSAVSNGTRLLGGLNASRSRDARRYRDVLDALLTEVPNPTEIDMALARRAAALVVRAEKYEAAVLNGEPVSEAQEAQAVTATNALRRVLSDLRGSPRRRQGGRK
jgi:hypothetical protein